jgi:hypothetical protein
MAARSLAEEASEEGGDSGSWLHDLVGTVPADFANAPEEGWYRYWPPLAPARPGDADGGT